MTRHAYGFTADDYASVAEPMVGIPGWQAHTFEWIDGGCIVTGCVPFGVYSTGKRKGWPRFSHPKATDRKRVLVSDEAMNQAAAEFEQSGKCWNCKGTGNVFASWSVTEGRKDRPCARCNGSGALVAEAEVRP